jgi:hypothetical protein
MAAKHVHDRKTDGVYWSELENKLEHGLDAIEKSGCEMVDCAALAAVGDESPTEQEEVMQVQACWLISSVPSSYTRT